MKSISYQRVHFIGIGGIGMSGIARLFLEAGCQVQGSDVKHGPIGDALQVLGASIFVGHDASFVHGANLVVYSSSIPSDHPERVEAKKLGIPVIHRSQALNLLCEGKRTIAVTGTHGKTTTTALVAMILRQAKLSPTVVVGGWVKEIGGNACSGSGPDIVIEADESDSSFLNLNPQVAVVTNIEEEHLDHFESIENIESVYERFLKKLGPDGVWFGCAEDPRIQKIAAGFPRARLYGLSAEADLWAGKILECPGGSRGISFEAWQGKQKLGPVLLKIPGRHNVLNALAAIGVGLHWGVPFDTIALALASYGGAGRRFDVKFENKDYLVVDDYAHHPTEVEKTLTAAKGLGKNRIVALFQPHRFSRTEAMMTWFSQSFSAADKLFLTDIYAASESPRPGVTGYRLYEEVKKAGHPDVQFVSRESLADAAFKEMRPGDLVLVMGAGDISQVATQLSEHLKHQRVPSDVFTAVKGKVLREEPLLKHTSLKVGGPAEFWVEPRDLEDLSQTLKVAQRCGFRITIFGAGSNLLPADEGLRGVVIHLGEAYFKKIWTEGDKIVARAGVPNTLFIQHALSGGFGGFEFLAGIPGNIGGSIAMNAGSHGQWIAPFLESVTTVDLNGQVQTRPATLIDFGYRRAGIGTAIVVEASLHFPKTPRETVEKKLNEYRDYRMNTQDLWHASAGCMFKNPPAGGIPSGRLIEEAGLKGLRIGDAQVSAKHANFIINVGKAKAQDVRTLIELVRQKVKEKNGIELETEVRILQ